MKEVPFAIRKFSELCIVISLIIISIVVITSKSASAHTLDLDGDIAVILHVNPNDMPNSGSPTSFILFFNDSTNRFALSKCDCRATILEGTQTIETEQLIDSQPLQSNDPITFPKPDVYTIEVDGKPKELHAFQPFFVSYNVRVVPKTSATVIKSDTVPIEVWIVLGVIVVPIFTYVIMLNIRERKQRKRD
jgi:hypothetical protein